MGAMASRNPFESDDHDPDEVPWLRDMVDDDLQILFVEDGAKQKRAVRHFIRASQDDPDVEQRLIELLETAVEEGNDDSSASLLVAIVLGEARSERAIPALVRSLASDADETLQDAAGVALLRIGGLAVRKLMEAMEESEDTALLRPAYNLLGQVGVLEDHQVNESVRDFLRDRVERERGRPPAESVLEELFRASALLGDRRQLPLLLEVLRTDYHGRHAGLQDVREMLEENSEGLPFVANPPPWVSRYGWLHEDQRQQARVSRNRKQEITLSLFPEDAFEEGEEGDEDEPGRYDEDDRDEGSEEEVEEEDHDRPEPPDEEDDEPIH